jgi:hypothetical protein
MAHRCLSAIILATSACACGGDSSRDDGPGSAWTGGDGGGDDGSGGSEDDGTGGGGDDGGDDGGTSGDGASGDGGDSSGTSDDGGSEDVCVRWIADRVDLSEGDWNGNVDTCDAGEMDDAWRERSLRQVNLYRWMAGLPPVTTDPARDAQAQECALMMSANGGLSHQPPPDWNCYTSDGASGAYNSCIAGSAAVAAVDHYMIDYGNETTMGHRRWILSNSFGPTGIGSTNNRSCLWSMGGAGNAGLEWVAWPPPGRFPSEAVDPHTVDLDRGGWTFQSDYIDLQGSSVRITSDGEELPVVVNELFPGPGSAQAIRWIPDGWDTEVGKTYLVEILDASQAVSYEVEIVDCG